MLTNENLPAPTNAWELIDRDLNSGMHRLYGLQSILMAITLALDSPSASESLPLSHLRALTERAFHESDTVVSELEAALGKITLKGRGTPTPGASLEGRGA